MLGKIIILAKSIGTVVKATVKATTALAKIAYKVFDAKNVILSKVITRVASVSKNPVTQSMIRQGVKIAVHTVENTVILPAIVNKVIPNKSETTMRLNSGIKSSLRLLNSATFNYN